MYSIPHSIYYSFCLSFLAINILGIIWHFLYSIIGIYFYKISKFIYDLLFLPTVALMVILILYFFSNGKLRWFYLIAVLLAIFCYIKFLSRPLELFISFLTYPINILIKIIISTINKSADFFIKSIAKLKQKLYNEFINN